MVEFTGWQYLLIDAANSWGLDKEIYENRIQWTEDNLEVLEQLGEKRSDWKEKPLYLKAVQAIRATQAGKEIGHLVGFDAACSGMQIMSAMTGCRSGALATGLVDPNKRADAYTDCTNIMRQLVPHANLPNLRDSIKQAVMTSLYGSVKEPEKLFGKDTPELTAFWKALYKLAPGASELLQALVDSWQPYALEHSWKLPDGFTAKIKTLDTVDKRISVDELGGASFTYRYTDNVGLEREVKNAANMVHSVDGYILRCVVRRCNYDPVLIDAVATLISAELLERELTTSSMSVALSTDELDVTQYYIDQYKRSGLADIVIAPYLNEKTVCLLTKEHLLSLQSIITTMLAHKPFEVVTIHDDFKCHPNNMNHLRKHYRNILAEIADSDLASDLLSQIYQRKGTFKKLSPDLSKYIRNSAYALC